MSNIFTVSARLGKYQGTVNYMHSKKIYSGTVAKFMVNRNNRMEFEQTCKWLAYNFVINGTIKQYFSNRK